MQRISNAKAATLKPILQEKVSPNAKQIVTDGHPTYVNIIPSIVPVSQHKIADHKAELEEFGELSAKTVEGAFSLFKRGVIGSYHHLSEDHLDSYLQEFCWRYNRRGMQPFMFQTLASRTDAEETPDLQETDAGDVLRKHESQVQNILT